MKTTIFKKTLAVLAAVMLVASMLVPMMSVTASAAALPKTSDYPSDGVYTLTIKKQMNMRNAIQGSYAEPDITFSYTVAPYHFTETYYITKTAAPNSPRIAISDGVADSVYFSMNNNAPVTTTTVAYTHERNYSINNDTAMGQGVVDGKTFNLYVDINKFNKPGVYRYVVTDNTTATTLKTAGITRPAGFVNTRYIDIYVVNTTAEEKTTNNYNYDYKIASAVMFDVLKNGYVETDTTNKTEGWMAQQVSSVSETVYYDVYRTYNAKISKVVSGDLGDKTNGFAFKVCVNNSNGANVYETGKQVNMLDSSQVINKPYFWKTGNTNGFNTDITAESNTSTTTTLIDTTLQDGQSIYIRGLTPHASICVGETNNATETYQVTIEGNNGDDNATPVYYPGASGTSFTTELLIGNTVRLNELVTEGGNTHIQTSPVTTYDTLNSADTNPVYLGGVTTVRNLIFTNTADSISPTGVVLRFGAFIIMAGFGVYFLILAAKSRRREATSVI